MAMGKKVESVTVKFESVNHSVVGGLFGRRVPLAKPTNYELIGIVLSASPEAV